MEDNNKILNIQELSSYMNCSVPMLRKLVYENKIPNFRIR